MSAQQWVLKASGGDKVNELTHNLPPIDALSTHV